MSVKINIHKTHRQHTNDQDVVIVNGATVGECFQDLIGQFPEMKQVIFDKNGRISNLIEVYLNMASAYPDELKKPVTDGDEIHILAMLAGG